MLAVRGVLLVMLLLCLSQAEDVDRRNVTTLRLIAVLPLTHPAFPARWERGLEILPGARLAVDEVNSMEVLPGYRIELVLVDEAACDPAASLVSFYEQVTVAGRSDRYLTAGVVGLMCAAVAKAVRTICGVPDYSLVQLSAGPSAGDDPEGRRGPLAYSMVVDSVAYASMGVALLDELGLSEYGVLYSGRTDAYAYYLPTAKALVRRVGGRKKLAYMRQVEAADDAADEIVADMRKVGLAAAYTSLDVAGTARVLCAAVRAGLVWPRFAWLVLNHEASELRSANRCSTSEVDRGLEGAIFLRRGLEPTTVVHRKLVTGHTYQEYLESLNKYSPYRGAEEDKVGVNPYASVLYDAVWSVALALNNSLESCVGTNATISQCVEKGLPNVSFNGAHDFVDFGNKTQTGDDRRIRVDQIISGRPSLVGYYFTGQNKMAIVNSVGQLNVLKLPTLEPQYALLSTVVAGIVLTLTGIAAVLITGILILLLYYRNELEIKATSPKISVFMFIGCYLLCASIVLEVMFRSVVVEGRAAKVVCNLPVWPASIGVNLILATLLVRLARVYYLFTHIRVLQKERELWTDRTLFCVVLLVVLGNVVVLTAWAVVDNYHMEDERVRSAADPGTTPTLHQHCKSRYLMLWLPLLCVYSLVLVGAIVVLTTLTRKIKRRNFKDTKKVNAFIFMMFAAFSIMIPLWWVSQYFNHTVSGMMLCLCYGITAVMCQLLLFVPKTIPPFIRDVFKTKLREEQLASSTDSEKKRPSLLRKLSSTAI